MYLTTLSRSLPITALALAALVQGCSLPQVRPRVAPDFASGATRVRRIALLPVDLSVEQVGRSRAESRALSDRLSGLLRRGIASGLGRALARKGYQLSAVVGEDGRAGNFTGGVQLAIHPWDLLALRVQIHDITSAMGPGPGALEARVAVDLTRQLGQATGADASLYLRGWAFVPPPGESKAGVIIAVILMVLLVGFIIMLLAGGKGSKGKVGGSGGGGRALAGVGRALGRAAAVAGHVIIRTAPLVLEAAAHAHPVRCYSCPPPLPPPPPPPDYPADALPAGAEASPEDPRATAPGPAGPEELAGPDRPPPAPPSTSTAVPTTSPSQPADPYGPASAAPSRGAAAAATRAHEGEAAEARRQQVLVLRQDRRPLVHPTVGLAVSLVQNSSGRVLWHAGQSFELEMGSEADGQRLVEHFLAELPPAR